MDDARFDRMTRLIAGRASRRGVMRAAGAGAVATLVALGRGVVETDAAVTTCVANGDRCEPASLRGCCSGVCAKNGGQHRCKPVRGALGCTVEQNACIEGMISSCPGNRKGICVIRDNGKPFCALGSACVSCAADADCDRAAKTKGSVCITNCPICPESTACVFPKPITMTAIASGQLGQH
jgi:hypothetical protein